MLKSDGSPLQLNHLAIVHRDSLEHIFVPSRRVRVLATIMLKRFSLRKSRNQVNENCTVVEDSPEFTDLSNQVYTLEGKLQGIVHLLTRHCNALEEIWKTSEKLEKLVPGLCPLKHGKESNAHHSDPATEEDGNGEDFDSVLQAFREKVIAPLQTMLAGFPKLTLQLDHRLGSFQIMKRYEKKLTYLEEHSKGSKSRIERNRRKLQVSTERFQELDKELRKDVDVVLSKDLGAILREPLTHLFDMEMNWSTKLNESTKAIQDVLRKARDPANAHMNQNEPGNDETDKPCEVIPFDEQSVASKQKNATSRGTDHESERAFGEETLLQPSSSDQIYDSILAPDNRIKTSCALALDKSRSLRPKRRIKEGTKTWKLHQKVKTLASDGLDIMSCVRLPDGCQEEEWIHVHVIDFFNEMSLLFGTISDLCTAESCPEMSAGPCYTYLWADGKKIVSPRPVCANEYVNYLLEWIETQLNEENDVLNCVESERYSKYGLGSLERQKFFTACKNIFKRIFRVYAHIYHSHLKHFMQLRAETHLNLCFKRFVCFVLAFNLVDRKELNALRKLVSAIITEEFQPSDKREEFIT